MIRPIFVAPALLSLVALSCTAASQQSAPLEPQPEDQGDPSEADAGTDTSDPGPSVALDSGTGMPPVDAGAESGPGTLPCDVDRLLASYCRGCHSAPPIAGAPMPLVTYDDLVRPGIRDHGRKVAEICASRMNDSNAPMPPAPLTRPAPMEIAAFQGWVGRGTPSEDGCATTPDAGEPLEDSGIGRPDAATPPPLDAGGPPPPPPDAGPHAILCSRCTTNAECNPTGSGNFCVQDTASGSACGTVCSSSSDCPSGYDCYQIVDGTNTVLGDNCFPSNNGSCFSMSPPDAGTRLDAGAGSPDSGTSCPDTWTSYAHGFFTTNCTRCHSGYGTKRNVVSNASNIQYQIDVGNMPRDTTLQQSEIDRIDNWFSCGLP
jgi:hypothetical protein